MPCDACRCPADTASSINCTKCKLIFHLACVTISSVEATTDFRSSWVCPNCRSCVPKGDNSNTPVRVSVTTNKPVNKGVTERQKKKFAAAAAAAAAAANGPAFSAAPSAPSTAPSTAPSSAASSPLQEQPLSEMSLVLNEIRLLRKEMSDIKLQLKEVTATCNRRMDELDKSLFAATHKIAELEAAQSRQALMGAQISTLEETIERQRRASVRNDLEIIGIPELPNENLTHLLQVLSTKIGVNLQVNDIDFVDRVGSKKSTNGDDVTGRSRVVVVRFLRRATRDSFLNAAKTRRNLTSNDIDSTGTDTKIFVNERLTKAGRQLFQEARRRSKILNVAYCWTKNATIFIRKAEGRPAVFIRNQADLERHLHINETAADMQSPPATTPCEPATTTLSAVTI